MDLILTLFFAWLTVVAPPLGAPLLAGWLWILLKDKGIL